MSNQVLGGWGEDFVSSYCQRKLGLKILKRNYRTKLFEVDILAFDPNKHVGVIIEVKTRRGDRRGEQLFNGFDAINKSKINKLERAAKYFLAKNFFSSVRVDVASVLYGWDGLFQVDYIMHAVSN